jgi:integrase/recombinase XerD
MTMKLSTTLRHVNTIPQSVNTEILKEFHEYLKEIETSENDQNQNLKQITVFARFLGEKTFYDIKMREEIVAFLNTKVKDIKLDPDKKWITTWNDYLWRIKYFFRWFHNYRLVKEKKDPGLASLYVAMYLYSLFQ